MWRWMSLVIVRLGDYVSWQGGTGVILDEALCD